MSSLANGHTNGVHSEPAAAAVSLGQVQRRTSKSFAILLISAIAFALGLIGASLAPARDSHAPKHAGDRWLPCEDWAMHHWVPFNERHLYALTGIKRWEFKRFIRDDDHNTLGELVRKRGGDPDLIVGKLMRQWRGQVSERQLTELTRRTSELMTQGHLAQHVFFHYFHDPALALNARWVFGVGAGDYHRARLRGYSPREIAEHGGRTPRSAVRRAMTVFKRYYRHAVRTKQTSRSQADLYLRQRREWVDRWLQQKIHPQRRSGFPHGHKPARGSRARQACTYFAGSSHVAGRHEGMGHGDTAGRDAR